MTPTAAPTVKSDGTCARDRGVTIVTLLADSSTLEEDSDPAFFFPELDCVSTILSSTPSSKALSLSSQQQESMTTQGSLVSISLWSMITDSKNGAQLRT